MVGRAAVERELESRGLLLVQGQWEVPSIADLLAGHAVTTRGFSWDYVPADTLAIELADRADVARCKLLRGRVTLVVQRLWSPVHTLALAAHAGVQRRSADDDRRRVLGYVDAHPGTSGGTCKTALRLDARAFQRARTDLERWLCIWGAEQPRAEYHTHDRAWFPWTTGKIAGAAGEHESLDGATTTLLAAVFPAGAPRGTRPATLFPALSAGQ